MLRLLAIALALHPCGGPSEAQQLVTVVAPAFRSTHATLTLWRRSGSCWTRAYGPWAARVGRNGLAADLDRDDGGARAVRPLSGGDAPPSGCRPALRPKGAARGRGRHDDEHGERDAEHEC